MCILGRPLQCFYHNAREFICLFTKRLVLPSILGEGAVKIVSLVIAFVDENCNFLV